LTHGIENSLQGGRAAALSTSTGVTYRVYKAAQRTTRVEQWKVIPPTAPPLPLAKRTARQEI